MRPLRSALVLVLMIPGLAGLAACTSSGPGSSTSVGTTRASGSSGTASSSDISFVVDGSTTYGTLEIPAHRSGQRLAAAVLIPGSGPTDRDGNDARLGDTAATLRLIADILAHHGIMTLRYDKYFAGKTGFGRYAHDPEAVTISKFLTQADAAYEFLSRQPQADPAKLLVVGHSEGGMIALGVATSVANRPAGLALLEPQDQRILNLVQIQLDEQINALITHGTLTLDQGRSNALSVAAAIRQFRAGQPVSTAGMATPIVQSLTPLILTPSNVNFERSDDLVVPAALAATVQSGTQVLVTDGTRDPNVPPSTVGPLMKALTSAGAAGPGLQLLQGTDHFMHLSNQPDSQAVLAPAAITAIQHWAEPFAAS